MSPKSPLLMLRALRCVLAGVVLVMTAVSRGQEDGYYTRLLRSIDHSLPGVQPVQEAALVDTNNTAVLTQGAVFRLDTVRVGGPIGKVRLGMSMDEVVLVWGKPQRAWWNYQGGPRFDYRGVILYFASNRVSGVCLNSPDSISLSR